MKDLFKLLNTVARTGEICDSYDERKVADKAKVNGLEVSTCWTEDMGFETAISDEEGNFHPVERYETRKEAIIGHKKWKEKAKTIKKITKIGYGDLIGDEEIILRKEDK